jgi:hypothetical protein
MAFNFDLNKAPSQQQFELIPNGTMAVVRGTIKKGQHGEGGYETSSAKTDAKYLAMEFTIMNGPFIRRRFWSNLTVSGGQLDDLGNSKGANVSRAVMRAMIESARGLDSRDFSPEGCKKRDVKTYEEFDGIVFATTIVIEKSKNQAYKDKNVLGTIITAERVEYQPLMDSDPKYLMPPEGGAKFGATPIAQAKPEWAVGAGPTATKVVSGDSTPPWQPPAPEFGDPGPAPGPGPAYADPGPTVSHGTPAHIDPPVAAAFGPKASPGFVEPQPASKEWGTEPATAAPVVNSGVPKPSWAE